MIAGTPAMTITLSSLKPGALEIGFSMRSAPSGMRAMRRRASFRSSGLVALEHHGPGPLVDADRHAERLGDRNPP